MPYTVAADVIVIPTSAPTGPAPAGVPVTYTPTLVATVPPTPRTEETNALPCTARGYAGLVVPMPTFPLLSTSKLTADDEATTNCGTEALSVAVTESLPHGVVVPMPTLPVLEIVCATVVLLTTKLIGVAATLRMIPPTPPAETALLL